MTARLLDPKKAGRFPFAYTPSKAHEGNADYLRAKFRRIRVEQAKNETEAAAKVAPLKRSKA